MSSISVTNWHRRTRNRVAWTEQDFLRFTEGSPIRRIGHERWLRNVAVALGNALRAGDPGARAALATRSADASALVREHVEWALARHAAGDNDLAITLTD